MTGNLIPWRILRPDGTEAVRGALWQDVKADAEREGGHAWWFLELAGWRAETTPVAPAEEGVP